MTRIQISGRRAMLFVAVFTAGIVAACAPATDPKPCEGPTPGAGGAGGVTVTDAGGLGGDAAASSSASGMGGAGDAGGNGGAGGACETRTPEAAEQPCEVDADCPLEGPCFDVRCFPSQSGQKACQPFVFRELTACIECGERKLCDWDGRCTIPEP